MKYTYYLLQLLLCFIAHSTTAQTEYVTEYNTWLLNPGDTSYIYSSFADIRTQANLSSAVKDSIPCGTSVIIQEQNKNSDTVRGIYAPWVKIKYFFNEEIKEGYTWLGNLAISHCNNKEVNFLYGIDKITAAVTTEKDFIPTTWYMKLKVLNSSNQIITEKELKFNDTETRSVSSKLLGDMGLKNVKDILRISFSGEACGVPTTYYYHGWTGNKFLSLPGKMTVGDADLYYHDETLLFPKEKGGKPDKIIKLIEEGEAQEKRKKNGDAIYKIKRSKETYVWNGEKAIKVKN